MELKFIKETTKRWYIDLPEWTGRREDLEMVFGADTLLDKLSNGGNTVSLKVELEKFDDCDGIMTKTVEDEYGATYLYKTSEYEHVLWLCPVTLFVLGGVYPGEIWIKNIIL